MGYKISYGPNITAKKKGHPWLPVAVAVIALAIGVRLLWPDAAAQAWRIILPVDEQTQEAFQGMVESVREGESFRDAVTVFCQKIIENAELPDGT